ncbi:hypothetical protein [uncultured Chryseobacterium sp.]|uniref:hypothetical protein n=1 Tax=uncultured Chryseobacterium sp. TaxID=259322 RepID=UPI0025EED285|nr:hypothetical protein [uncultured Chryseobacterium sp.]
MKVIVLIFFLISELLCAQMVVPDGFGKIPDSLYFKNTLYRSIIPDKKYEFWEVIRKYDSLREDIIYKNKDWTNKSRIKVHSQDQGFFIECLLDWCFTYIMLLDDKKLRYINNEEDLRNFIGYVDNLQEALLIAGTYGFWFDKKDPVGGTFREDKDYFYLYLAKSESCPVSREAFFIKLNKKTRTFESQTKGGYYKTGDCFIS